MGRYVVARMHSRRTRDGKYVHRDGTTSYLRNSRPCRRHRWTHSPPSCLQEKSPSRYEAWTSTNGLYEQSQGMPRISVKTFSDNTISLDRTSQERNSLYIILILFIEYRVLVPGQVIHAIDVSNPVELFDIQTSKQPREYQPLGQNIFHHVTGRAI